MIFLVLEFLYPIFHDDMLNPRFSDKSFNIWGVENVWRSSQRVQRVQTRLMSYFIRIHSPGLGDTSQQPYSSMIRTFSSFRTRHVVVLAGRGGAGRIISLSIKKLAEKAESPPCQPWLSQSPLCTPWQPQAVRVKIRCIKEAPGC